MIYDKAHALAGELAASEEYTAYKTAKEAAMENETNRVLLEEYKKLSLEAQAFLLSGRQVDSELMQKINKLNEVLALNAAAQAYLLAEYRFNRMMGDVFKILADAVEVDLGFLRD